MNREIQINQKEALRYLGYHQQVLDENTRALLDAAAEECLQTAKPKYIWQLYQLKDMALYPAKGGLNLRTHADIFQTDGSERDSLLQADQMQDSAFAEDLALTLPGKNIAQNLAPAYYVVLFSATLGIEMDKRISLTEHKSMTKALMLDACASSYIETICDLCNEEVRERFAPLGYKTLPRFSPGYGDLPISLQGKFCQLLDTHRKIGLSCSSSNLLIPRKSVTAIIGLAKEGEQEAKPQGEKTRGESAQPCSICQFRENCQQKTCIQSE